MIPVAASETPHVLDNLLHDKSAIAEHATDPAGAVETDFVLFRRFASCIRDLHKRKLF